mgnify:CR=1 FL=1
MRAYASVCAFSVVALTRSYARVLRLQNVLVDEHGVAVITDLGLAKSIEESGHSSARCGSGTVTEHREHFMIHVRPLIASLLPMFTRYCSHVRSLPARCPRFPALWLRVHVR